MSQCAMDSAASLEERLRSFLAQLRIELGILDRIVYKGKNQHRRCLYFKHLLKVRRDVKLLLSANLEDVFSFLFQVVNGKKANKMVSQLESLKKHRYKNHNFLERLLGIARLLSQMVGPILKAAIQISSLLAQSFFMGFSLTNLAILARLRVLVQQMLLDVVALFNMVSSISQEEQSVKLSLEGVEVAREYHPPGGDFLFLECEWKEDKFVLHEKVSKNKRKILSMDTKEGRSIPCRTSTIQYERIELSNQDDELPCGDQQGAMDITRHAGIAIAMQPVEIESDGMIDYAGKGSERDSLSSSKDSAAESLSSLTGTASWKDTKKVAFVAVRKADPSEPNEAGLNKKLKLDEGTSDSKDARDFFNLLISRGTKDSLF